MFEQQFESEEQGIPVALHAVGRTQVPLQPSPVQHSEADAQAAPWGLHVCNGPHVPPLHPAVEQHSLDAEQMAPSLLQVRAVWHVPLGHEPEQQSEPATQETPFALHPAVGFDLW